MAHSVLLCLPQEEKEAIAEVFNAAIDVSDSPALYHA